MKRLFSIALTLLLVLSMGTAALAVERELGADADWDPIKINKEIELTNEGTVNPAESFEFTVGNGSVVESPAGITEAPDFPIKTFSINFDEGQLENSTDLVLPDFPGVGVYLYEVNEVGGNTAGYVYDNNIYYLKVTVVNDGQGGFNRVLTLVNGKDVKTDAFKNTFSAGDLVITKEITGNYAVYTDEFDVTVTLTPGEGENIKKGPITVTGAVDETATVSEPDVDTGEITITFKVTDDSTVTIANIPYNVSYEVAEESGSYDGTITDLDEGIIDGKTQTVEIVNDLSKEIATGVNLNSLPYFLILGLAGAGIVGFTVRRRLRSND